MTIQARGTKGFFLWLRSAMPEVYRETAKEFKGAATLQGIGLTASDPVTIATEQPATRTLSQTIQDIALAASQVYLTKEQLSAQRRILDMQLQRAQNNLPPLDIDPAQYGVPRVEAGLSADTRQLLMWGGALAAGLFLFSQMRPARHR